MPNVKEHFENKTIKQFSHFLKRSDLDCSFNRTCTLQKYLVERHSPRLRVDSNLGMWISFRIHINCAPDWSTTGPTSFSKYPIILFSEYCSKSANTFPLQFYSELLFAQPQLIKWIRLILLVAFDEERAR